MNVFNLGYISITAVKLELENTIASHYVAYIKHTSTNTHFVVESFGRELSRITHFDNLIDGIAYYDHVHNKVIEEGWKNVEMLLDDKRINVQGSDYSFNEFGNLLRLFIHRLEEIDTVREYITEVINEALDKPRIHLKSEGQYGEQWGGWA